MSVYKRVLILFLSSIMGLIIGYTNAESTLTRIFQNNKKNPLDNQ